jgi:hypothetical protein
MTWCLLLFSNTWTVPFQFDWNYIRCAHASKHSAPGFFQRDTVEVLQTVVRSREASGSQGSFQDSTAPVIPSLDTDSETAEIT